MNSYEYRPDRDSRYRVMRKARKAIALFLRSWESKTQKRH